MDFMNLLTIILIFTLGLLVKNQWFNPESGIQKTEALEARLELTKERNQELKLRNSEIQAEIESIKFNYDAREELARKHLGLIQQDETFFHITPADD